MITERERNIAKLVLTLAENGQYISDDNREYAIKHFEKVQAYEKCKYLFEYVNPI